MQCKFLSFKNDKFHKVIQFVRVEIIYLLKLFFQVFALEEVNVRKAINRYGTLPKGARIGAYLDSLRPDPLLPSPAGDAKPDFLLEDESVDVTNLRKSSLPQQRSKKPVRRLLFDLNEMMII